MKGWLKRGFYEEDPFIYHLDTKGIRKHLVSHPEDPMVLLNVSCMDDDDDDDRTKIRGRIKSKWNSNRVTTHVVRNETKM
uniref:Ovule protein n=1 Tax=Caenorhabditis tropicalis TaxID=1561998 RepID=A0A1I7UPS9_9PELO